MLSTGGTEAISAMFETFGNHIENKPQIEKMGDKLLYRDHLESLGPDTILSSPGRRKESSAAQVAERRESPTKKFAVENGSKHLKQQN